MSLQMPLLSVIMPVFNVEEFVAEAVNSILTQDYQNFELIIIDDCSRDKTYEIIQKIAQCDSRIRIIKNKCNRGLVQSLNTAIMEARGDLIARMDGDDISLPGRFSKQIEYLRLKKLDLVGCQCECISNDGKVVSDLNYPQKHIFCKLFLRCSSCMAHPSWLGQREIFTRLMYRDIQAYEDYDFLVRAVLDGYKIGNLPERAFCYRLNPNGISGRRKSEQLLTSNRISKAYRKNGIISFSEYEKWENSGEHKHELEKLSARDDEIRRIKALSTSKYKKAARLIANISWRHQKMRQIRNRLIVFIDKMIG